MLFPLLDICSLLLPGTGGVWWRGWQAVKIPPADPVQSFIYPAAPQLRGGAADKEWDTQGSSEPTCGPLNSGKLHKCAGLESTKITDLKEFNKKYVWVFKKKIKIEFKATVFKSHKD